MENINNAAAQAKTANRFSDCRDLDEVREKACSLLNSVWNSVHEEYNRKIYELAKKAYAMHEYIHFLKGNKRLPSECSDTQYPFFVDCTECDCLGFQFSGGVWFEDEGRNLEEEKTFYENRLKEVESEWDEKEDYLERYGESEDFLGEFEKIAKEGEEKFSQFGGGDWEELSAMMYEDFWEC